MRGFRDMSFSPRYYVLAANLLLLAAVAYLASSIVGTALAAKLVPPPDVVLKPPPAPIELEGPKPAVYYAVIHKRDIFNSAPPPAPAAVAEAPVTTPLQLKLWGVCVHDHARSSYSIIEDLKAHKQGVYGIDEPVPGGATVKTVEWDRVILDHNGKDEVLELANKSTLVVPKPVAAPAPSPPSGDGIQATGENEYLVPRSEVDNAMQNMSQLFTQIRAVPHFEGGQSIGFRLFAIRRGSLFDKIGLKNGDIITEINGSPMNDPSRAMALLQELQNANDMSAKIIRNQQPTTLTLNIR
jgi:general secretion pathway protein C